MQALNPPRGRLSERWMQGKSDSVGLFLPEILFYIKNRAWVLTDGYLGAELIIYWANATERGTEISFNLIVDQWYICNHLLFNIESRADAWSVMK